MEPEEKSEKLKRKDTAPPSAGGFFLAAGCIAGVIIGGFMGQPSIGFLTGLGLGGVIALAMWYADRNR
ncbi:MAG: hypothetical protein AAF067_01880 [Pseudomonadota bacterium]